MKGNRMRRLTIIVVLCAVLAVPLGVAAGCAGPTVPNVVGMRQDEAVRTLQEAGYLLGDVSFVATQEVPLGMIAGQRPGAGETAKEGTPVALEIASRDGSRVLVPILSGMARVTAEGVANTLGLVPLFTEQYSPDIEPGTVAAQVPDPGAEVAAGSTLVIVLSKGEKPETASVPDVDDRTRADATSAIEDAGLTVRVYEVFSDDVSRGRVITQVPAAGATVTTGSRVDVVVSLGRGEGTRSVPSVTGGTESAARTTLEEAGFTVNRIQQYDDSVNSGSVIAQFPTADARAIRGSEVVIVVSRGTRPAGTVAVPDVMGTSAAAARAALEDEGFSVTFQPLPTPEEETENTGEPMVVFQFPSAGAQVLPGSSVLIAAPEAP